MAESTFQKHVRFVSMALTIGLVTVFVTVPVNAQQIADTSGLYGNVRDTSDAVIAGAQVEAKNLATGVTRRTVTTQSGDYAITNLPAGNYVLTVRVQGFKTLTQEGIVLRVDQRAMVNVVLEVGSVNEEVTVRAEAPLIETSAPTLKSLLDQKRVADLPLQGRNILDLTLLAPGVQD